MSSAQKVRVVRPGGDEQVHLQLRDAVLERDGYASRARNVSIQAGIFSGAYIPIY